MKAIDLGQLKALIRSRGVSLTGFADLTSLPAEARGGFSRAIAMAAAYEPAVVRRTRREPSAELRAEFTRASELMKAVYREIADLFAPMGLRAVRPEELPGHDTKVMPPHRVTLKMAATLAGLGWIGRCGLLVTAEYGPAVRLLAVLTDAELPLDEPVTESQCPAKCRVCAEACEVGAIRGGLWRQGVAREELLDVELCGRNGRAHAERLTLKHPTCGRCMAMCIFTQKHLRRSQPVDARAAGRLESL